MYKQFFKVVTKYLIIFCKIKCIFFFLFSPSALLANKWSESCWMN